MAVKSVFLQQNTVANTLRGPSAALWSGQGLPSGSWIPEFIQDPSTGIFRYDDFNVGAPSGAFGTNALVGSYGTFALYGYANATMTDASTFGGGVNLVCGSAAHNGIALTSFAGAHQICDTTTTMVPGALVFEAAVSVNNISTAAASQMDCFVGLTDKGAPTAGVPITTTTGSLYNSCNLIGFQRVATTGNDWSFVFQASGVAAVYPTNLQTLVTTVTGSALAANQTVKLGFIYNPRPTPQLVTVTTTGNSTLAVAVPPVLQVFVNGIAAPAFLSSSTIQATNFPQGFMGPALAVMNASTATGLTMTVSWSGVAQQGWQ